MKRRSVLTAAAATVGAGVWPSLGSARTASVLKFVPQSDLALLDPVQSSGLVTRNHGAMVFDQLYGLDVNFEPQPQMVAGHTIEDQGKVWKLTLRDGLKFHDGSPVLARDCVASIMRWWSIDPFGQTLRATTDELSAPSDKVIQFRLKKPFPLLPYALGKSSSVCFIMPERLAKTSVSVQITEMVGSGPFRFIAAERVSGQIAVYEKFAGYVPRSGTPGFTAGPKIAYVDRVEWHTLPDAATAAAALQAGEMDWWEQPTPDLLPMLKKNKGVQVAVKDKGGYLGMIRFNCQIAPFNNPAIRRAFLAGINQADYMTAVMGEDKSLWKDNCGFFLPGTGFASNAGMEALTSARSLDKVKKDLAAAGYKGEKIVFLVPTDLPALNAMSEIAADMFRRVGINVDYQAQSWGTVLPRLSSQKPIDQGGWNVWCNYLPGLSALNPAAHSFMRGMGLKGPVGWPESAKLESFRDAFIDAPDLETQKKAARDMQAQAFQDVPYIPTGFYYQPTAFRTALTGIVDGIPVFWNVKKS